MTMMTGQDGTTEVRRRPFSYIRPRECRRKADAAVINTMCESAFTSVSIDSFWQDLHNYSCKIFILDDTRFYLFLRRV